MLPGRVKLCVLLLAGLNSIPAAAGEISGLRPLLPTHLGRDLEVTFSNDFLGRGGSVDDFRTQQIIISAELGERWLAAFDHSILTLEDEAAPGRIDQLSVSLGYELIDTQSERQASRLAVGTGLRSVGQFDGERIQNGAHRLIGSDIENLPYTGNSANDLTAWFDAEHYQLLRAAVDGGTFSSWRKGIWLRASSLMTTRGEWDSSLAALGVISRDVADIWLGVRRDWRSGYDATVLRETAAAESDTAIVLGARFGALVIETVQQLDNDASYGQLRLVSSADRAQAVGNGRSRLGIDFGVMMPDVQLRLTGRLPVRLLATEASRWREAFVIGLAYGEPQYKSDRSLFVRSRQVDLGLDFEWPLSVRGAWISAFGQAGVGWRDEKLTGAGEALDASFPAVGRAVLTTGLGLRFESAGAAGRWRFRVQLALVGRLPASNAQLQSGELTVGLQRSALDLMLGTTLDFE